MKYKIDDKYEPFDPISGTMCPPDPDLVDAVLDRDKDISSADPKKVYFEHPKWAVLRDAETHDEVLQAPREYCLKVAAMEKWEVVDPPKEGK